MPYYPPASGGSGGSTDWNSLPGKPSTFPPTAHTHEESDVDGLDEALTTASESAKWDQVSEKPESFTPSVHTHSQDQVDGLATALSNAGNTASWANVSEKPSTFTPSAHSHSISDVTGLADALEEATQSGSGYLSYTGTSWPSRGSSGNPVMFVSTSHAGAPAPEDMEIGDMWIRHPDDLEAL